MEERERTNLFHSPIRGRPNCSALSRSLFGDKATARLGFIHSWWMSEVAREFRIESGKKELNRREGKEMGRSPSRRRERRRRPCRRIPQEYRSALPRLCPHKNVINPPYVGSPTSSFSAIHCLCSSFLNSPPLFD